MSRNYIRKLRHTSLSENYISVSAFASKIPTKIYICIWPSEPNLKRFQIMIRASKIADDHELALVNYCGQDRMFTLKFSKTSQAFDEQGFFWTASKGHHFEIYGRCDENEVVFGKTLKNKNNFFRDLLDVSKNESIHSTLSEYVTSRYDVFDKNTYGFAIYLQVKFRRDKVCLGKSCEEVYRFEDISFEQENINISALLYEYPRPKKSEKISKKNINVANMANTKEVSSQDMELDVRSVFKGCLTPFMEKFRDQSPADENYNELIEDILKKLSGIAHDN